MRGGIGAGVAPETWFNLARSWTDWSDLGNSVRYINSALLGLRSLQPFDDDISSMLRRRRYFDRICKVEEVILCI